MRLTATMWLLAALALPAPALLARGGEPTVAERAEALVKEALGDARATAPEPGRELFMEVLGSKAFVGAKVGPFDVYVRLADGLASPKAAGAVLDQVLTGLKPAAELVSERFTRPSGLVSGHRFPLVFVDSKDDQQAFKDVLALLDRCEDGRFSGWKPDLPVYNEANQTAAVVNTWEVLLFNLANQEAKSNSKNWLAHGVGYRTLNFLSNLLLQVGAFGPMPPWLQQGLADELDIAAYGTAWVASGESESWTTQTSGWTSRGWEGFLPEGQSPPPPVYDPPKDLGTTYTKHVEDDGWIARSDSPSRHWNKLSSDLKSAAPPSLQRAATMRDYTPRDRAWARLVLHLVLAPGARPEGVPDLLMALDSHPEPTLGGLRGGEPLAVVVARSVGGVPALEPLEAQTLREQLVATERANTVREVTDMQAAEMLDLRTHADQSDWLYYHPEIDSSTRFALFNVIVNAEYAQQLREWEVVGAALDRGAAATIQAVKTFPKDPEKLSAAGKTFAAALAAPPSK